MWLTKKKEKRGGSSLTPNRHTQIKLHPKMENPTRQARNVSKHSWRGKFKKWGGLEMGKKGVMFPNRNRKWLREYRIEGIQKNRVARIWQENHLGKTTEKTCGKARTKKKNTKEKSDWEGRHNDLTMGGNRRVDESIRKKAETPPCRRYLTKTGTGWMGNEIKTGACQHRGGAKKER